MNASEITFGIEIECYVPTNSMPVGGYHNGVQIPGFPQGWTSQRDGSLHTRRRGYMAVEVVSPVLRGVTGLEQVKQVVASLNAMGAKVNDRCGFHVHVGVGSDVSLVQKVVHLAANFEKALYAATGTKSRERGGFCRPISGEFRNLQFGDSVRNLGAAAGNRYHVLNVTNLISGSKPTVEFRAFAGTLNIDKIVGYVLMCVGIVERASTMTRPAKWESRPPVATSPIHRSGEGQTALTRLYYALGWIKGRQSHTYGNLSSESLPTIARCKKTLMKLARKYDQPG
jgi:hypothetical protein